MTATHEAAPGSPKRAASRGSPQRMGGGGCPGVTAPDPAGHAPLTLGLHPTVTGLPRGPGEEASSGLRVSGIQKRTWGLESTDQPVTLLKISPPPQQPVSLTSCPQLLFARCWRCVTCSFIHSTNIDQTSARHLQLPTPPGLQCDGPCDGNGSAHPRGFAKLGGR